MDIEALRDSPIGQLVPIRGHDPRLGEEYEYVAYVPDPLPSNLELKAETYAAVIDAAAAMARADQASSLLPNPSLLARPATRREAVSTSALEGTYALLADVFEADFLDAEELTGSVSEVETPSPQLSGHTTWWPKDNRYRFGCSRICSANSCAEPPVMVSTVM